MVIDIWAKVSTAVLIETRFRIRLLDIFFHHCDGQQWRAAL